MDGWKQGWIDGLDGWKKGWKQWRNGLIDRWMKGWTERRRVNERSGEMGRWIGG